MGLLLETVALDPAIRTYDRTVGDLQAIGYCGQPVREVFRRVDPPRIVLIDLGRLFPREPHSDGRYHPFGLQMHAVVEGELTCWGSASRAPGGASSRT